MRALNAANNRVMNNRKELEQQAQQIVSQLIQSDEPDAEAIETLAELGEAALDALSTAIDSEHPPAQRAAAISLSRLETRRALAPILNGVLKLNSAPDLMATLLHSAAGLLTPRDKERVRPLILRCLQHGSPSVRLAATECARATEDEKTLAAISQSQASRQQADAASQRTVPRAASMDLIKDLGSHSESERRQAATTLLQHPDRDQIIVEHLHHPDPYIRRSVLEVAAVVGDPAWNQALIDITADETRELQERVLALRGVQYLSQTLQDRHLIATLLQHESEPLRAEAGRLAATSSDAELRQGALNLLSFDAAWVRKRVAEGWATFTDTTRQSDLPHLIDILRTVHWRQSDDPIDVETFKTLSGGIIRMVELGSFIDSTLLDEFAGIRLSSALEISEIAQRTTHTLSQSTGIVASIDRGEMDVRALYDEDPGKRLQALERLRSEPASALQEVLPDLIRFLYRANPEELVIMVHILAPLQDQRAIDALTRMLTHPEPMVRQAVQQQVQGDRSS